MDQEFWTTEHMMKFKENVDEATFITETLKRAHQEHLKDGCFFNATKSLLNCYRQLRFDFVNEKMLKTTEAISEFSANPNSMATLDNIIAMPEIYNYYSKEISDFISSNTPVIMGKIVHIVDTGIKIMKKREKDGPLKYSEILEAVYVKAEKSPETLIEDFNTNRATFYRKKDEAITALSIIIFGSLGDRHPSSIFDDSCLKKKYTRFMEVSDAMDLWCDMYTITEKYREKNDA